MEARKSEIADRLHSAAIHLLRRAAEEDRAAGPSRARLSALSVVVFRGPLTLGELAAAEAVRSATMTGIVNGLERDGLVRRRPHGRDRRSVNIEATAAGRRVLQQARERRIERVASQLDDLTAEELELLGRAAQLVDERFSPR